MEELRSKFKLDKQKAVEEFQRISLKCKSIHFFSNIENLCSSFSVNFNSVPQVSFLLVMLDLDSIFRTYYDNFMMIFFHIYFSNIYFILGNIQQIDAELKKRYYLGYFLLLLFVVCFGLSYLS